MIKFYEGQTVQTIERETFEEIEVPQVVFCVKLQFKTDVLTKLGLQESFLYPHSPTYMENVSIPDIKELWENATYNINETAIRWTLLDGLCDLISVI